MQPEWLNKYAVLLTEYCLNIQPKDRVLIRSTPLAAPLILACQKDILLKGAHCEMDIALEHTSKQFYEYSSMEQLNTPPILYKTAVTAFNKMLSIQAPYNIHDLASVSAEKKAAYQQTLQPIKKSMMDRSAANELDWALCNYPTQSLADAANMTLEAYEAFIAKACFLHTKSPTESWQQLSNTQEQYVQRLNQAEEIRFVSNNADITFNTSGRIWINSNGKRNMPSGEVFTSPVEDSANGWVRFDVPSLLFGTVVTNLTLHVTDGVVCDWECDSGHEMIEKLLNIDGANRFGEIAIGTNPHITTPTLNTLLDEKIGGTIHMALGASYPETGGKNVSGIHHDFVTSFNTDAEITLDNTVVYKEGVFLKS